MANKKILVSCKNISYKKGKQLILKDISLNIYRGDVVTIIGPNGGGKTSLAKIIIGVEKHHSGIIKRSRDIKIGYMPQKINFNPLIPITVKKFLLLSFNSTDSCTKKMQTTIKRNKINNILNRQLNDLSGGELQRVMLTMALLKNPDLLVLDEPTQALDVNGQDEFYSFIEEIKNNEHKTIIIISHDLHTVMKAADKVICLNKVICCSGMPERITEEPAYKELFFTKKEKTIAYYKHKDKKK
jgi:zinc transport system ATP-binding protein